jgi:hypothetical protein
MFNFLSMLPFMRGKNMKINIEKCNDYFDMSIKFDIRQVLNIELKIVNANGYEIGSFSKEQLVYQIDENNVFKVKVCSTTTRVRVYAKVFSEGKLVEETALSVETNSVSSKDEAIIINRGSLVEDSDTFKEAKRDSLYIVHNPKISWRVEENKEISMFTVNGELLYLREYLAVLWNAIGEGIDYRSLIETYNNQMTDVALEIMSQKKYIRILDI